MKAKVQMFVPFFVLLTVFFLSVTSFAEEIRIGVIVPLTGGVATDGKSVAAGAEMAADQINITGGVLGRELRLIIEDGACQPDPSRAAAEKLITKDKVNAIIGAFCSSASLATKPVAEKYGIPMVSFVSTSPKLLEKPIKYYFRRSMGEQYVAEASSKVYVDKHRVKNVCILALNDDWGRNATQVHEEAMTKLGVKILNKDLYPHGATDFAPYVTKLRGFKPDGVILVGETQYLLLMVKELHQQGVKLPILAMGGAAEAEFIRLAGKLSNGIIAGVDWSPGIKDPLNIAFCAEFKRRYPQIGMPGKFPAAGYDAVFVLSKGIEMAGGTDPDKIVNALGKLRIDILHGKDFHFTKEYRGFHTVVVIEIKSEKPEILALVQPK